MTQREKIFGLVVEQVEFFTFTIAHAVVSAGWRVVILADPTRNTSKQNELYIQRLSALPGVSIEMGFQPIDLEFLYVELTRQTPRDRINYYNRRAQRIGIMTFCARPTWMRTVLAELLDARGCLRCVLRATRVVYVEGYRAIDLFGLLGTRRHLGIDVHSQYLLDPDLRNRMFALDWEPGVRRPHRLNFMGSTSPELRERILGDVEASLTRRGASLARSLDEPGEILWFGAARVSWDQFSGVVAGCDFTLCPPGHVRVTHRVVEALVRGSIPILHADELQLYDLDLESGKNCIAVPPGRWGKTVLAAIDTPLESLVRMRENILAMREKYLSIAASNQRLCVRLGIEG
jgi:hypothetical protein